MLRRGADLLSLLPLAAILALVALVWVAVWTVSRSADEQARVKIATDALWVEQALRFQIAVDEDMLAGLALDAASGIAAATLDTRARTHIAANPEMRSVVWFDAAGRRLREIPGPGAAADPALIAQLMRVAGGGVQPARPVIGQPSPEGLMTMGLALPGKAGFVSATLSLPAMLNRHIPWWIAEQYGVQIQAADGRDLAIRQRVQPTPGAPSHRISIDPPLRGAVVQINAYDVPPRSHSTLQLALVLALAAFSVLALGVLFRSGQRRRAAETRLRDEMAFRRAMEESLTVGLRAKDDAGRILYVNAAFCSLIGWRAEELIGRSPPMPYWVPDQVAEAHARQSLQARHGDYIQSFETRFRHRDGHEIDVQVYEAPLIDATGRHRGWMGSVIDVTEQKANDRRARAQAEVLERNARMVALGEMASTLAHELNQPLAAIASYAAGLHNLLGREDLPAPLIRDASRKLAGQAERAGQILQRIRNLVRRRTPEFGQIDLSGLVEETVRQMAPEAGRHHLRLIVERAPHPAVAADRVQLGQVLTNLLRNAIEAMATERSDDRIWIRLGTREGMAAIDVEDCGPGVPPGMDARLFDSFATTKPEGMGMGLAICRSILELHRGQLVHLRGERGALFRLTLPPSAEESA